MRLGIDIGVGGRFHADRLAGVFLDQGHDVRVWSTYPRSRFPLLESHHIESVLLPEILYRAMKRVGAENFGDITKMRMFGKALARHLEKSSRQDLFIGWSSFSLETLRLRRHKHLALIRDSAHLRKQMDILSVAYSKFGIKHADRSVALEREEEEYERADTIFVLSQFARRTFLDSGIAEKKLQLLPLGVDTRLFRPVSRESYRLPLRMVYFGSVSIRKGIPQLLEAVAPFSPKEVQLTVVGPIEPVLRPWIAKFRQVEWKPAMPQPVLAAMLPDYDIFVLPTLEDGFGQTLVQAMASGLVPLATDRCGAAEHIHNGVNGRIIPAGDSKAIADVIGEWVAKPDLLMAMRESVLASTPGLGWNAYGEALTAWMSKGAKDA